MLRKLFQSVLCIVLTSLLAAQQGTTSITVPKDTKIELMTLETISTQSEAKGSVVRFAVARDIAIDGVTVIPAGMPVTGVVTKANRGIAYKQWPTLRIHVKGARINQSLSLPLSPWSLEAAPGSWKDRAQCVVFFVVCLALRSLGNNGWGEDGAPKPDHSSGQQAVLPRCVAIDFWTVSATTVSQSDLPPKLTPPTLVRFDCVLVKSWSDAYQEPGLGRVFFR
jgi:hypothetical protein